MENTLLRQHAEQEFAEELAALHEVDARPKPPSWVLSPWAVVTYLMGDTLDNGFEVTPKYIGSRALMEIAVATLATDRALLLYGCLLYTSPSPRDRTRSRMPSSA